MTSFAVMSSCFRLRFRRAFAIPNLKQEDLCSKSIHYSFPTCESAASPAPNKAPFSSIAGAMAARRTDSLGSPTSKIEILRSRLDASNQAIAMAAHNSLAAKFAYEAGFDAVSVSGFELSASYAVPDASILPMSAHLDMARSMAEVQNLPLVVDMDTGFGNTVTWLILCQAMVIEDKTFPKDSSLREVGRQALVSIEDFQGKIAAAKAASGTFVIARTEALIAGLGQEEALRRGEAYAEAGADAVLIHSKQKTPHKILSFCRAWDGRVPLVLVPTSFPQLSFADIAARKKVGMIICGNHAIRSAVAGMRKTFKRILEDGGISEVEEDITPVSEIFKLQDDEHMYEIEKAYLR